MWQVGATCYSTKTAANQAIASGQAGTIVQHAGAAHVVTASAVAEDGIDFVLTPFGGGAPVSLRVTQDPQPCGLLTSTDTASIAWAIAFGWIAVYLIKSFWQAGKIHHDA